MSDLYISIILPQVSNENMLLPFLENVFSQGIDIDVSICSEIETQSLSSLSENNLSKIKVFPHEDKFRSVEKAVAEAEGSFLLFSDVNITYSENAFASMLARGACAFNGSSAEGRLFSADFAFDELASKTGYFCCLMAADTVRKNGIMPAGGTPFSIMNMIADYARYDEITVIHESLFYISALSETSVDARDIATLENYSWIFSQTASDRVVIFYIRNVMSVFSSLEHRQTFELLKSVLLPFMGDYAVCAWFKSVYGWDAELLKTDISMEDFRRLGTRTDYREVIMPMKPDDAVMNFYSGKFSAADLKRCIFAYVYFKAYRMKPGFIRDKLCGLCKRKLGGDFDA